MATHSGGSGEGTLQLEGGLLIFFGAIRLRIPFQKMTGISTEDGALVIGYAGADARFELGDVAGKWAQRLLNPPSLLDKLGVKPGMRVSLIGGFSGDFVAELKSRAAHVSMRGLLNSGAVLLMASTPADLDKVAPAITLLRMDGGLWIVYPKGKKSITQNHVLGAGRAAGLTDNKVAAFSESHTALRFVIPVKQRGGRP